MALVAATITRRVVEITSPSGQKYIADAVIYTISDQIAEFEINRSWTPADNGDWRIDSSNTDKVFNTGNKSNVGGALIGTFNVNIPAPAAGTLTPTFTLVSITPSSITTAGNQPVKIRIRITET